MKLFPETFFLFLISVMSDRNSKIYQNQDELFIANLQVNIIIHYTFSFISEKGYFQLFYCPKFLNF